MSIKNKKDCKWFKIPKNLLLDPDYAKLNPQAQRLLPNLFSLNNSYKGDWFYQTYDQIKRYTGMSAYEIRVAKKSLEAFGAGVEKRGVYYFFNVADLYKKYIGRNEKY